MRVASLRLHWSVPNKSAATGIDLVAYAKGLWGYVQEDSVADAFLLAIEDSDKWSGHEAFFIVAPENISGQDSKAMREKYYPGVPIRKGMVIDGSKGFFDCSKAGRLLGWVHKG
jgi:nucleoside-diphosphate-sugar epimerase